MKIIHTSDWHIGHQLYGYDRMEEQKYFFKQLKDISIQEHPDALVVSGDIFDVAVPSAVSAKFFTDFILELHAAVPEMVIVITAGNHDSASRIDVNRNLWGAAGIYVIGSVKRSDGEYDFSNNIISIKSKGFIVAIPYINRAFITFRQKETDSVEQQFFSNTLNVIPLSHTHKLPVILMAHLTVKGCDHSGHKMGSIGNVDAVDVCIFPKEFDYVALGHIHRPHTFRDRIRYSGSPLALNFDESYPHSISIVNINQGMTPHIKEIEIKPLRRLITFPSEAVDFKKALKLFEKFPSDEDCYIRLNVSQTEDLPSDCEERASKIASSKKCKYCTIKYTRLSDTSCDKTSARISATEFTELSPEDIASRFFRAKGLDSATAEQYVEMLTELKHRINAKKSL